jgi:hypothetical protein
MPPLIMTMPMTATTIATTSTDRHLFGGENQGYNQVQVYNAATNSWAYFTNMPLPLGSAAVVEYNGIVYVVLCFSLSECVHMSVYVCGRAYVVVRLYHVFCACLSASLCACLCVCMCVARHCIALHVVPTGRPMVLR